MTRKIKHPWHEPRPKPAKTMNETDSRRLAVVGRMLEGMPAWKRSRFVAALHALYYEAQP